MAIQCEAQWYTLDIVAKHVHSLTFEVHEAEPNVRFISDGLHHPLGFCPDLCYLRRQYDQRQRQRRRCISLYRRSHRSSTVLTPKRACTCSVWACL